MEKSFVEKYNDFRITDEKRKIFKHLSKMKCCTSIFFIERTEVIILNEKKPAETERGINHAKLASNK